jgi:hypothetical protein
MRQRKRVGRDQRTQRGAHTYPVCCNHIVASQLEHPQAGVARQSGQQLSRGSGSRNMPTYLSSVSNVSRAVRAQRGSQHGCGGRIQQGHVPIPSATSARAGPSASAGAADAGKRPQVLRETVCKRRASAASTTASSAAGTCGSPLNSVSPASAACAAASAASVEKGCVQMPHAQRPERRLVAQRAARFLQHICADKVQVTKTRQRRRAEQRHCVVEREP